ncbi:MAG TPA: GNAT family N-acetyltransferase [Thermoleophilaceae bacterium]|nr:GNAT family N-acetyltransferase [Thermoleophilaceae bacterium]
MIGEALTERLRLRPWSSAFAEPLAAMNRDPEVMRFIRAGAPLSREESLALSERLSAHWAEHGFGLWAAETRASGEFLGFVGLSHPLWFPDLAGEVEVGWRLARHAWGHGYATEGAREAVRVAFTTLELRRVVSLIHPENTRSRAVAERLGFALEYQAPHPTEPIQVAVYTLSRPSAARPA